MFFLLRQCSVEVFNGSLQWKCSMEVLMEVFNELNGSSVEELPHSVSCLPQNFPDVSDWAGTSPQPRPPCCVCAVSVWVWWLRFPDRGIFIVHPYVIDTPRARPGPRWWNPVQKSISMIIYISVNVGLGQIQILRIPIIWMPFSYWNKQDLQNLLRKFQSYL